MRSFRTGLNPAEIDLAVYVSVTKGLFPVWHRLPGGENAGRKPASHLLQPVVRFRGTERDAHRLNSGRLPDSPIGPRRRLAWCSVDVDATPGAIAGPDRALWAAFAGVSVVRWGSGRAPREVLTMDQQQRQKMLLAALAVVALGAGSWFAFLGKPPPVNKLAFQDGPLVTKVRSATTEDSGPRKKPAAERNKHSQPPALERKVREVPEREKFRTKDRRPDRGKEMKKKGVTNPA